MCAMNYILRLSWKFEAKFEKMHEITLLITFLVNCWRIDMSIVEELTCQLLKNWHVNCWSIYMSIVEELTCQLLKNWHVNCWLMLDPVTVHGSCRNDGEKYRIWAILLLYCYRVMHAALRHIRFLTLIGPNKGAERGRVSLYGYLSPACAWLYNDLREMLLLSYA